MRCTAATVSTLLLVLAGCQQDQNSPLSAPAEPSDATAQVDIHAGQSLAGPESLMKAKLAHSQAVLEGIALEDFQQILKNAQRLTLISQEADWQVRRTIDYKVFSTEFRRITQDMVNDAQRKNLHAVTLDYMQMIMTCVKCHSHMRHEGLAQGDQTLSQWELVAQPATPSDGHAAR